MRHGCSELLLIARVRRSVFNFKLHTGGRRMTSTSTRDTSRGDSKAVGKRAARTLLARPGQLLAKLELLARDFKDKHKVPLVILQKNVITVHIFETGLLETTKQETHI